METFQRTMELASTRMRCLALFLLYSFLEDGDEFLFSKFDFESMLIMLALQVAEQFQEREWVQTLFPTEKEVTMSL